MIGGVLKVGLTSEELLLLAHPDTKKSKLSSRDMAHAMAMVSIFIYETYKPSITNTTYSQ